MVIRTACFGMLVVFASALVAQEPEAPETPAAPAPANAFGKVANLKTLTMDEVVAKVTPWIETLPAAGQEEAKKVLAKEPLPATGPEMVVRLGEVFAAGDLRARELVDTISRPLDPLKLPDVAWLADESVPVFVRDNLRVMYGRWLGQERLFDESADVLGPIKVENVADPASLYFYQAVAFHRLLDKKRGLESIEKLLQDVSDSPRRYTSLASLMHDDLAALKDDSLDHISRRMEDVERRLDIGRAGKKVRSVEDGIVKSLDKLIEELEKQQQQQQASGASGALQPSQPAQKSAILGGQGPGNVDPKKLAAKDSWGDLPPKKREEALQQIPKNFPSHYRDIIEQYFRRSTESGDENK